MEERVEWIAARVKALTTNLAWTVSAPSEKVLSVSLVVFDSLADYEVFSIGRDSSS